MRNDRRLRYRDWGTVCQDGKILHFRDKISCMQKVKVLLQHTDYTLLFGAREGTENLTLWKTTVTAKLSSGDGEKASDWAPLSDTGSCPYPVTPNC